MRHLEEQAMMVRQSAFSRQALAAVRPGCGSTKCTINSDNTRKNKPVPTHQQKEKKRKWWVIKMRGGKKSVEVPLAEVSTR